MYLIVKVLLFRRVTRTSWSRRTNIGDFYFSDSIKNATKYHSTICSFAPNRNWKKRLGELIFFISKCQRNHILVCTLFPTVVFDALLCQKSFAYQVLTYAFNHNAIDSKHFEKVLEISSSTFTRKIGQLNQWLQKYQIEINLKRTNVLVGKEKISGFSLWCFLEQLLWRGLAVAHDY